jgi:excisionase family DNA binding protein
MPAGGGVGALSRHPRMASARFRSWLWSRRSPVRIRSLTPHKGPANQQSPLSRLARALSLKAPTRLQTLVESVRGEAHLARRIGAEGGTRSLGTRCGGTGDDRDHDPASDCRSHRGEGCRPTVRPTRAAARDLDRGRGGCRSSRCPKSRIYDLVSARRIPHERDGSRLLFRRSALDGWVTSGGGRRR